MRRHYRPSGMAATASPGVCRSSICRCVLAAPRWKRPWRTSQEPASPPRSRPRLRIFQRQTLMAALLSQSLSGCQAGLGPSAARSGAGPDASAISTMRISIDTAEEIAGCDHRLAMIEADLALVKWMLGLNLGFSLTLTAKTFVG